MNKLDKAYNTYVRKHKELVAKRPDMYGQQYTKDEFEKKYEEAKLKGKANPARTVALDQREWSYNFERSYYKLTGYKVTGQEMTEKQKEAFESKFGPTESKKTRKEIFDNFWNLMIQEDSNLLSLDKRTRHQVIEDAYIAMY